LCAQSSISLCDLQKEHAVLGRGGDGQEKKKDKAKAHASFSAFARFF
jgi:hypothetical protein